MELLEVENLKLLEQRRRRSWFRYDLSERVLIDDVSFSIEKWRSLGIVGEENSGKHALVMALLKFQEVSEGRITFGEVVTTEIGERHFRRLRKRIQALFSEGFGQLTPELTVDQMFREVLAVWFRREGREAWERRVEEVMVSCGLPEAVRPLYPAELDAVERQQVALARALLSKPDFLICHGFTKGLDAVQEGELLNLIRRVREQYGLTLLVTTDDLAVAHQLSDDIGVLHRGRLVELADAESIVNRPVHDYTRRLVSFSL
ncbi:MAG: ATP-binding cassette domain-containing protein [Verrucomicrobiales bacterium]|nr:ATP-binding cassette domain-containing protein [Verrucomicrobiales bacterium]